MTVTDRTWEDFAGFWTGFEEVPGHPGTCILRTHPVKRLISETVFLVVLWSTWLMVFTNDHSHSSGKDTFLGTLAKTFTFLTSPIFVWGYGMLLVFVSIMALPQTLIFGPYAPLFTHIIGFERFGIRLVRPRSSVRGLKLVYRTWKGQPSTHTYVAWNGIGLPAMISGCRDYEVAQDYADYISSKTGILRLSVDRVKEEALRQLWLNGCFSVLFGTEILWAWLSKGNQPLDTDLAHAQGSTSGAVFSLLMSLLFLPIALLSFILTTLKLARMRKQSVSLEVGRVENDTSMKFSG